MRDEIVAILPNALNRLSRRLGLIEEPSESVAWGCDDPSAAQTGYSRALGDLVRSLAGHCSETAGNDVSLPVIRSGAMA